MISTMSLLTPELLANIGRESEAKREIVTRRDIRKYAIATNNPQRKYLDGDEAPPMFHVPLFGMWLSSKNSLQTEFLLTPCCQNSHCIGIWQVVLKSST